MMKRRSYFEKYEERKWRRRNKEGGVRMIAWNVAGVLNKDNSFWESVSVGRLWMRRMS